MLAGCWWNQPKVAEISALANPKEKLCLDFMEAQYKKIYLARQIECTRTVRDRLCEFDETDACVTEADTLCRITTKVVLTEVFKSCINRPVESI
jgi:hypothetical protein